MWKNCLGNSGKLFFWELEALQLFDYDLQNLYSRMYCMVKFVYLSSRNYRNNFRHLVSILVVVAVLIFPSVYIDFISVLINSSPPPFVSYLILFAP